MLKIPDFIKPEIDFIKANANFTEQETMLFDLVPFTLSVAEI